MADNNPLFISRTADKEALIQLHDCFNQCKPTFIALGDEVRLTIINALAKAALIDSVSTICRSPLPRGLSVNEITNTTKLSRPAISHHLKILKRVGLVDSTRIGTSNIYYLTFENSSRLLSRLNKALHEIWPESE
ncbi:metalloregulator ArsR/SmtB family transcription factor [Lachnospiraceae bacterium 62-35]